MKKKRILFLYELVGFGHKQIANATAKRLKEKHPEFIIKSEDLGGKYYPFVIGSMRIGYSLFVQNASGLYNYLYHKGTNRKSRFFLNLPTSIVKEKFKEFIQDFNPDLIVSAYALDTSAVSLLNDKELKTKLIAIATDFFVHSYYISKNVDKYCVASKFSKRVMVDSGADPKKIEITGLPVTKKFLIKGNKQKAKRKFGFSQDKTLILIVGGGLGLGRIEKALETLDSIDEEVQIAFVAGKNENLYKKLTRKKFRKNVKIYGFIKDLDSLMDAADIYVGRAGGNGISEVFAKRIPMIYFGGLPSQERANAEYLESIKVGFIAKTPKKLKEVASRMINKKELLINMKKNIQKNNMDKASDNIIKVIEKELNF
ncbi:hypothetical protein COU62_03250 [Candidatus Pacearchaeota archaeon CG10_big_fil_rev_8_21_14_0_10_35_219]|nr:hypothetical protein [Candidatus Pacearchaeota archaeon]OIO42393.1 MAG: hypothetical protein AUJ63_03915 [Candidatus Pacearchaeota archaeon CG1_02_35_32]PIO07372.1 MAG: hypothetical protein COU62_03250 [Candidatus Pacearchaeota archaeon CG10_big_fil_rev_8_21_14_0_10_35_219]PJB94245.1 MAG: hypothetical protein CO081_01840 [Candidatus Pacearchaeota archaeon CG_4_9_14_0_8_um_filter_35_24]